MPQNRVEPVSDGNIVLQALAASRSQIIEEEWRDLGTMYDYGGQIE
jgi:hypothetical protein